MVLLRHITAPSPADAVHYHSAVYSKTGSSDSRLAKINRPFQLEGRSDLVRIDFSSYQSRGKITPSIL